MKPPRSFTRPISPASARRLSLRLCATLGAPESAAWSDRGHWRTESTWRFRTDAGSGWARLGFGPTRKMVTLATRDGVPTFMHVYITGR